MASIFQTRAGGNWTAQTNIGGKRQSKTFPTKRKAQRWARQTEAALDAGKRVDSGNAKLGDLIAAYALEMSPSRSKASALRLIADFLGRRKLADLDAHAFIDFASQREAMGAGPATILQDFSYIGVILKHGGVLCNVGTSGAQEALGAARTVLGASGRVARSQERTRRPTGAEIVALRDFWAKRRRGIPMWTLTQFAIATGMRLSEITRIAWDDLDEDARTIVIRDRKHPRAKAGNHQTVPLLCGPVQIDGEVVDPLSLILDQRREDPAIFPYDAKTISTMFTRAVASCGIDDLRFHDLRHEATSRLFEAGYAIEQVSLVTGHKDWNQLRRYTQLDPASLHREAAQ